MVKQIKKDNMRTTIVIFTDHIKLGKKLQKMLDTL